MQEIYLLVGLVVGAAIGFLWQKSRVAVLESKAALLAISAKDLAEKNTTLNERVSAIDILRAQVETQKKALEDRIEEQKQFMAEAQKNMKEQFENIANKQLQENNKKFVEDSSQNLGNILKPLSDNIEKFKKEFSETYDKEARERFALGKEIQKIVDTNSNLTKALKGDNKVQGNWGEIILERLLEDAGLKKEIHFTTQEGFFSEEGKLQLPDVIIRLPEEKHIIVDSKVSLVAYEKYFAEEDETQKILHARAFIDSVKNHIKGLSNKSYQDNENFSTLDFVIMFMPIEGTFQLAQQYDSEIFSYGWNKKVIITSPATLFPILKTISSIWKVDAQSKNTQEIIRTATQLYDKFMSFAKSLEEVGKHIEKTDKAYKESVSKLKDGRGNAMSIVRKLENFGIEKKGNKDLPEIALSMEEEEELEEAAG